MEAARLAKVAKVVNIGTACSYPGYLEGHLKEQDLWAGPCHASVVNYGLTKKMLAVQGEAYKKQYGLDSIHLILTNLYGPGDSYNTERSHVVAALVRKWVEAEIAKAPSIEVWGTGKPVREFIYVEDCADAIVLAAEKYNDVTMPLEYRHRHRHLDSRAGRDDQRGHRLSGQDRLERRQARRGHDEGARRHPDEAGARRLGAADRPEGGPGQDDRLVPGQQGPGGRQMVNRRHWYPTQACRRARAERSPSRRGLPARPGIGIDPGEEPSLAPHSLGRRTPGETGAASESSSSTSITGPTTPRRPSI